MPIGNDVSFLLAEVVLAQVDKRLKAYQPRVFRWFDDYEIAADTREQAEEILKELNRELGRFRLRLNPKKTTIRRLPSPSQDAWQETLKGAQFNTQQKMIQFFDAAFRFREELPDEPVMMYALGLLFKIDLPTPELARIAQSCITQALLCEPGAAQKAFALLTFWKINGANLNAQLIANTISKMIAGHQAIGFSSDIAWALAFCLDQQYVLSADAGQALSVFDDDCIALQALDMEQRGLLPRGFKKQRISKALKNADLDRDHWLIAYETVRHGFLTVSASAVRANLLFSDFLKRKVTFYRRALPPYAALIHPGGAPSWVVSRWLAILKGAEEGVRDPVMELIGKDFPRLKETTETPEDTAIELLGAAVEEAGPY